MQEVSKITKEVIAAKAREIYLSMETEVRLLDIDHENIKKIAAALQSIADEARAEGEQAERERANDAQQLANTHYDGKVRYRDRWAQEKALREKAESELASLKDRLHVRGSKMTNYCMCYESCPHGLKRLINDLETRVLKAESDLTEARKRLGEATTALRCISDTPLANGALHKKVADEFLTQMEDGK